MMTFGLQQLRAVQCSQLADRAIDRAGHGPGTLRQRPRPGLQGAREKRIETGEVPPVTDAGLAEVDAIAPYEHTDERIFERCPTHAREQPDGARQKMLRQQVLQQNEGRWHVRASLRWPAPAGLSLRLAAKKAA